MRRVPFSMIEAAKKYDAEAVEFVFRHFEGFIIHCCQTASTGGRPFIDGDLYDHAQAALLSAISRFQFRTPPPDFKGGE